MGLSSELRRRDVSVFGEAIEGGSPFMFQFSNCQDAPSTTACVGVGAFEGL